MIIYKKCSEVDVDMVFKAFSIGFSDYIIKFDMTKDFFINRFFGPEGNDLENSFIAIDADKPVGIVLSGIKEYEGIKTMRCGTMAVAPDYRGTGISKKLMELHKEAAINNGCKQLFLEVVVGNDRAINFYKKLNYNKIYDISYFTLSNPSKLVEKKFSGLEIRNISIEELKKLREKISYVHLNWQGDMEYIEKSEGQLNLGVYINNVPIGAASINKNSRVSYIWVDKAFEHKGIAENLLIKAVKELGLTKLSIAFSNNANLEGFLKHIGFERDKVSQYEMYHTL